MFRRALFRRALAVALALCVFAGSACSQGNRQRLGDALSHAAKLTGNGTYVGQLVVVLRPKSFAGGAQAMQQAKGGTLGQFAVTLERGNRRAALSPKPGAQPIVLFDPETVYARRVTRSPYDRRKWARFEYQRQADVSVPTLQELGQAAGPGDVAVIDPVFVTDLLTGALTGSIKLEKTAQDGSRLVSFNTSISKAERKLKTDERERKQRKKLLRSLAITGDIHKAEAILRTDGTVSSVRVLFAEHPDKRTELDLETTLALVPVTAADNVAKLAPPNRDVTVRVPALADLKGTIKQQLVASGGRL
jgi:hypothetical protein